MIEKKARLAEIIFRNEDNFYTVAHMEDDENMEEFIAVGNMPAARTGMLFKLTGDWKTHPSYGEQFAFVNCTEEMPANADGIREFLSSGIIRGIGPKTAAAIVSKFGDDTLKVLEIQPERLKEISGIGESKLAQIVESYQTHREFAEISMFFANHGISATYAMKMYKIYAADTIKKVMENPYRLINDIRGIGFTKADEIAESLGIATDSQYRIKSGIRYMLNRAVMNGNTFMPFKEFYEETASMLDLPSAMVKETAEQMSFEDVVRIDEIDKQTIIYPSSYFRAESDVAKRLFALHSADVQPINANIDDLIMRSQADMGIKLSQNQIDAVRSCASEGVCVITGGPGTGKTTIINTIITLFENSGLSVAIAAPTGRAAKRITETSGHPAFTIHRLLEYYYSQGNDNMNFGKNSEDTLDNDVIIIDEMSMVDILLMDALTEAIVPGTRVILVGDADQLPSVGAGNVLRDIINSEMIHTVRLTEIFRQAEESMIVVNAHRINNGERPFCNEKEKDFFFMQRNSEQAILGTLKELCTSRLPKFYSECDSMRDIQVLTPMRKGILGTLNLNKELQHVLNPPERSKPEKILQNRIFRVGDKVMQIKNNYSMTWKRTDNFTEGEGIFNGDIGFIDNIDFEDNKLRIIFDDIKYVEYDFNQIDELELAYAMTIHKSQGSEFPVIVMPMTNFPLMLATRNLLYTGVTRGKKGVVLVGMERMLYNMIDNNRIDERHSGLRARLQKFQLLENL